MRRGVKTERESAEKGEKRKRYFCGVYGMKIMHDASVLSFDKYFLSIGKYKYITRESGEVGMGFVPFHAVFTNRDMH